MNNYLALKISKNYQFLTYFLFFFIIFSNYYQLLYAQRNKKDTRLPTEGYVSTGMHAGIAYYFGDLYTDFSIISPTAGAFILRKLSPHLFGRLGLNYALVQGDDARANPNSHIFARNLHFRNAIKELNAQISIDLWGSYGKFYKRRNLVAYLATGISIFHHNPQAKIPINWGRQWVDLQPLGTEGQGRAGYPKPYSKIQIALPLSVGLKWKINDRSDFQIETCFRYTSTDYLDDVSKQYPDLSDLANPLAVALSNRTLEPIAATTGKSRNLDQLVQKYGIDAYLANDNNLYQTLEGFKRNTRFTRGNTFARDFFLTFQFQIEYIMNVGLKCPKFK
ncbi:MAG: hypothetical protein NZ551_05440 [Microscillaceae bacterium]|nr:hypothetical protein [Microscillaceae bacterium]MDW8460639.1 hypothetical protein [Cytophagales bacterium]